MKKIVALTCLLTALFTTPVCVLADPPATVNATDIDRMVTQLNAYDEKIANDRKILARARYRGERSAAKKVLKDDLQQRLILQNTRNDAQKALVRDRKLFDQKSQ